MNVMRGMHNFVAKYRLFRLTEPDEPSFVKAFYPLFRAREHDEPCFVKTCAAREFPTRKVAALPFANFCMS